MIKEQTAPLHKGTRLNLFWKILIATLIASLIPLALVAYISSQAIQETGATAAGVAANKLDEKSIEALRVRAEGAARQIESLLEYVVRDVRSLSGLPPDEDTYLTLFRTRLANIWLLEDDTGNVRNVLRRLPLYREMAFIDPVGQEVFRIVDGQLVPPEQLRDVSNPANTTYKTETYFAETIKLERGEIYVSPIMAWHLSTTAQPAKASDAASSTLAYIDYEAIIRFATPVFEPATGELQGVLMLALDHRHVMEAVNHINSLYGQVVWPDYTSGNYAYLVDFEGWLIAHPDLNFLRGLKENGEMLPSMDSGSGDKNLPFNMLTSDIKPIANKISSAVLSGETGNEQNTNREGATKVDVYVPIRFNRGVYQETGVFGGVILSENVRNVEAAGEVSSIAIENAADAWQTLLIWSTAIGMLVLIIAVVLVSRNITVPIVQLTQQTRRMEMGEYDAHALDNLVKRRVQDEVTDLSRVFRQMAKAVQLRETRLKEEIRQLRIEIDEQKKQEEVRRVVESEAFQVLQAKAANLRARRAARERERQERKGFD